MYQQKRISFLTLVVMVVSLLRGCGDDQPRKTCQADSCSGHGTCDDTGGTISCECDPGYAGDTCDSCATGFQDYGNAECLPSDPCAEDTVCAASNRVCTNDQGSAVCGGCLAGYHDEAGDCVEDESCLPTSCSGHGTCEDTGGVVSCTCDDHYTGDNCEACEDGYVFWPADSGTCVDDPCDPYPCDVPNAVADGCVQTDVAGFDCTCETGYAWDGAACLVDCEDADNDGYGTGSGCAGPDCDDNDPDVFEGNLEICDDKDNDCDPASADGSEDPMNGAACDGSDSDLCQEGTYSCSDGSLVCSDNTGDDLDLCNGLDDDCNAATVDGADEPTLGDPCDGPDSDLCNEGSRYCAGASGMLCDDNTGDTVEVCDGADNDCDGVVDCGGGECGPGAPCYDGDPCTVDSCNYPAGGCAYVPQPDPGAVDCDPDGPTGHWTPNDGVCTASMTCLLKTCRLCNGPEECAGGWCECADETCGDRRCFDGPLVCKYLSGGDSNCLPLNTPSEHQTPGCDTDSRGDDDFACDGDGNCVRFSCADCDTGGCTADLTEDTDCGNNVFCGECAGMGQCLVASPGTICGTGTASDCMPRCDGAGFCLSRVGQGCGTGPCQSGCDSSGNCMSDGQSCGVVDCASTCSGGYCLSGGQSCGVGLCQATCDYSGNCRSDGQSCEGMGVCAGACLYGQCVFPTGPCGQNNCAGYCDGAGFCSSSGIDCGLCCICDDAGHETFDWTQQGDCGNNVLCGTCSGVGQCWYAEAGVPCGSQIDCRPYCNGMGECLSTDGEYCGTWPCESTCDSSGHCRSSGNDCGVCCICNDMGRPTYDETQDSDCAANDPGNPCSNRCAGLLACGLPGTATVCGYEPWCRGYCDGAGRCGTMGSPCCSIPSGVGLSCTASDECAGTCTVAGRCGSQGDVCGSKCGTDCSSGDSSCGPGGICHCNEQVVPDCSVCINGGTGYSYYVDLCGTPVIDKLCCPLSKTEFRCCEDTGCTVGCIPPL